MKSTTKLGMFNTFFSIFGAILNAIEMIEGFYIWIFANSMWIIYNYKTKKSLKIAEIYTTPVFNIDYRCDLHPRLSNKERLICVDTTKDSLRKIMIINLFS